MAQNTVVEYVLKVNAQGAKRALDTVGDEAKDTSKDFKRLEQSTDQTTKSMKRMDTQTKLSMKSARNFRRAGRDLDGALGDLAQGIGHVNPQLGHFLMSASDGVSIVEGLGRSMTLLLNPAVLGAAAIALAAGGAMAYLDSQEEKAKEQAEALAKSIEESNKRLEEQAALADGARRSIAEYTGRLQEARTRLQLLAGGTNEFKLQQEENRRATEEFGKSLDEAQRTEQEALKATTKELNIQIEALEKKIELEKENRVVSRVTAGGPAVARATDKEKELRNEAKALRAQRDETEAQLKANQANTEEIERQKIEYRETLNEILLIQQANKEREAAEKRRLERLRKQKEEERKIAEQERARLQAQAKLSQDRIGAQQQITAIIQQTQRSQLSERDAIIASYQDQIAEVRRLAKVSGATNSAEVAIKGLLEQQDQALFDLAVKKQEQTSKELEQQDKIAQKQEEQLSQVDRLVKLRQKILQLRGKEVDAQDAIDRQQSAEGALQKFQTLASLDAASIIGLISPIAGGIAQTLIQLGQKTPEQLREEVRAQAKALAAGLAILPELFLQILPELAVAITEAIYDGIVQLVQNLVEIIKNTLGIGLSREEREERRETMRRQRKRFVQDFFDPDKSASYASGGRFLPSAQGGIRYTGMKDGLAMLHRGEFVVPQSGQRPQQVDRALSGMGGGVSININSAIVERSAVDSLVRQIEQRFNAKFGVSSSNLFGGR